VSRLAIKSALCAVDDGFWEPEVVDAEGNIITPRTKVHDRLPKETVTSVTFTPAQTIFQHTGGPNVVWPTPPKALSYL